MADELRLQKLMKVAGIDYSPLVDYKRSMQRIVQGQARVAL